VPSPQIVAAWTRLSLVRTETVPLWAAHWLVAGHDGEHLVHLAGLHGDDPWDVSDALPDALRECGAEMPSDEAAATAVLIDLARTYLDGQAGPLSVDETVEAVLSTSGYPASELAMPDLFYDQDWDRHRSVRRLTAFIREACEKHLRNGTLAT
jgi:hypothetical protein